MTKKLEKQHLDAIQSLRAAFAKNASDLGYISIEEIRLQRQLADLQQTRNQFVTQLDQLIQQETAMFESLKTAYGEGEINVEAGTFTPAE
jgi:hypothetical protein